MPMASIMRDTSILFAAMLTLTLGTACRQTDAGSTREGPSPVGSTALVPAFTASATPSAPAAPAAPTVITSVKGNVVVGSTWNYKFRITRHVEYLDPPTSTETEDSVDELKIHILAADGKVATKVKVIRRRTRARNGSRLERPTDARPCALRASQRPRRRRRRLPARTALRTPPSRWKAGALARASPRRRHRAACARPASTLLRGRPSRAPRAPNDRSAARRISNTRQASFVGSSPACDSR